MRKERKQVIALSLAMVMAFASLTACTSKEGKKVVQTSAAAATIGKTGETTAEVKTETVELSVCSADNTFGISTDSALQKAIVTMLENKTNTKITSIIPPISSYNEKLDTMVAGGDVPDIFCISQAMTRLPNFIAREKVLQLNDYIANSEKLSGIDASLYDALSMDGKIYHIPYLYPKAKILFLRKDVMDQYKIQLSNTPTTDEFITEMSKLKGSGIIPFSFPKWIDNFQFFMNSYHAYAGVYKNEIGEYIDGFQETQMLDALKYLRELYTSGVMDQEFITTENATMREYVYTGKAASDIDYVTNYTNYITQSAAVDKASDMFPIYALVGPNGNSGCLNESVQTSLCISADCKDPDRAMEVIETLVFDPEMYAAFFNVGIEGEHYTVGEGKKLIPTEKASNSGYAPTYTYLYDSFIDDFSVLNFEIAEDLAKSIPEQQKLIVKAQENKGPKYVVPAGISDIYDQSSASITSTWKEIVSQVILGTVTPEEGMENYKSFWNSIDGEAMLKELNGK